MMDRDYMANMTFLNTSTTDIPNWTKLNDETTLRIGLSNVVIGFNDDKLPKEYWINEKKKTIVLKWDDDTITKVKVSENDKFDARFGFLLAYFQKKCGLSKTQANKYLENIEKEKE